MEPTGYVRDESASKHAVSLIYARKSSSVKSLFPTIPLLPSDAFCTEGSNMMGRRVAGSLFATAIASQLNREEELLIWSYNKQSQHQLQQLLEGKIADGAIARLIETISLKDITDVGAIHLPGPGIASWTWIRERTDARAFSFTGIIHTLCSREAMRSLQDLVLAPVYEWDAVVCTSTAGKEAVLNAIEIRLEAAERRFGLKVSNKRMPQFPIIPLAGTTEQPYSPDLDRRARRKQARQDLSIDRDAFVVAFVGRLCHYSKGHPLPLYRALGHIASSGKNVILLECGYFYNEEMAAAYEDLKSFFPGVDFKVYGGDKPADEATKWQVLAAADVFTSPADNLQETFGLTLLEAMAAELPIVASNWSGYRDLVKNEVNGYLIPVKDTIIENETGPDWIDLEGAQGNINYTNMIGLRSLGVALDTSSYTSALMQLCVNPEMAEEMGKRGNKMLRSKFSEQAVIKEYRELYKELASLRASSLQKEKCFEGIPSLDAPHSQVFQHYASNTDCHHSKGITLTRMPTTTVSHPINKPLLDQLFGPYREEIISRLGNNELITAGELMKMGIDKDRARQIVSALSKIGLTT